tara:strand:+ start:589 stop:1329 length:741 start_codon:yes stop_codon:yes gene_type:complete
LGFFRYKIVVQYDGTDYHGWQIQKNHKTIQGELENALSDLAPHKISICGSGRTDSGVHALAQVAHFDLLEKINPELIINSLNAKIDRNIRVLRCGIVNDDFHARFSATKRSYIYRLRTNSYILDHHFTHHSSPLDLKLLNKASQLIIGDHDFTSFSKNNPKITNRRCIIYDSIWKESESVLNYNITGNRFLHHMVRYLVGTMIEIGKKKYSLKKFERLLTFPKEDVQIYKAPPNGLILEKVDYEKN